MSQPIRRRDFLASSVTTTAALAAIASSTHVNPVRAESKSANNKLNIAIIGCGGRGRANMGGVSHENIYALCDIHDAPIQAAKKTHAKAKVYHDWRELVQDPKIDAVVVSTADHHHAPASIAAMRENKHVYSEKPLAHTVYEARKMQDEYKQRKDKIATQMGTQIHATANYRRVVELVQSGAIGDIKEAHVWCNRSIRAVNPAVLPKQEKPKDFHWDVWLGPAADRPYNTGYWKGGNLNWNRRWDFGNGVLGDMGSHLIDLPYWALELRYPTYIRSWGPKADPVACPPWQVVRWEHKRRGMKKGPHMGPCDVIWYHGPEGMKRRSEKLQPLVGNDTNINKWGIGVAFVGKKGTLVADYGKYVLSPSADFKGFKPPKQTIAPSIGHHKEWTEACKGNGVNGGHTTLCNFDYSGRLIEHNLLGNVAHRVGRQLSYSYRQMLCAGDNQAQALLTKDYRKGWEIG